MQMTKVERAAQLSARGVSTNELRSILGVSTAWVKRLETDPTFLAALHAHKDTGFTNKEEAEYAESIGYELNEAHTHTDLASEAATLNDKYTALEHKTLRQLMDSLTMCTDPRQLVGVLSAISARQAALNKTPLVQINTQVNNNQRVVNLTLPSHAIENHELQLSPTNEVIAIGDRSLSSMTTQEAGSVIEKARVTRTSADREAIVLQEFPDL